MGRWQMESPFQIGVVVSDLARAMADAEAALGLEWIGPRTRVIGGATIRVAFAMTPPPHLELIEGTPGTMWDATTEGGIHHAGYWSDDLDADSARLAANGFRLELDLGHARYHLAPSLQTRIELIDRSHEPQFYRRWGLPRRG